MTSSDNPYLEEVTVSVYDARNSSLADLEVYAEYAGRQSGALLELACGTGRVLLPLARAGHEVTGIDNSPFMLERLREKLQREPVDVRRRVSLSQQDIRAFQVDRKFGLAFVAVNSFIFLTTAAEQQEVLIRVREHLNHQGLLILDLFVPDPNALARAPRHLTSQPAFDWPERDAKVLFTEMLVATDNVSQTQDLQWTYEVVDSSGNSTKYVVPLSIRYTYPQELVYLLERCGFTVIDRFGGWQHEPFDEKARRMVVVAQRQG